jgi:methionyl aminopeptidase
MSEMNKINIKTQEELATMRKAGKILSEILTELRAMIKPGLNVWNLEDRFVSLCDEKGVLPACKNYAPEGYPPFPTGLCVSINSQSVHCFPRKNVILKEGDLVNVDTVITLSGLNVDSAFCECAGKPSDKAAGLMKTAKEALNKVICKVKEGTKIGELSNALQKTVEQAGFNVLKDYAGHGIGYHMHEDPEIPCYGSKFEGPKLKEGMTICIEALTCSGNDKVQNLNSWETKMADSGLFCIFEHTILVTKNGYEILTE